MTIFEKIKLQEAYQKVLNESWSWGDIVNAGLRTMANGSPIVTVPYKPGTNELKSSKELQQEQKNSAIAVAVGVPAGAAVVNPAAAATVGKYALNGFNALSNVELAKDFSDNSPDAANLAAGMAILKPRKAANIAQKVLNSRWGWIPGVGYAVIDGLVDGYSSGVDSQSSANQPPPSANQQTTANANQQTTANANQQPQPSANKQPTATDAYEAKLAYYDSLVQNAYAQEFPISTGGTNNLVRATGASHKSKDGLRYRNYKDKYPHIHGVLDGQITRDIEKDSNSGK